MGSDSTSRTLLTLVGLALLAWGVWLVRDVLPPFLIALLLTLLLDPVLDRIQRFGIPRWGAVALTFTVFLALFVGLVVFIVPRAGTQISELVNNMGHYRIRLQTVMDHWTTDNAELLRRMHLPETWSGLWQQNQDRIAGYLQVAVQGVFETLQASVGRLGWLIIVPIVTLYLLMDLENIKARVGHLIPSRHRGEVVEIGTKVGRVFAAYLRGLFLICAAYGLCIYLLLVLGFELQYALILGLSGAVLYAVPYLGQLILIGVACAVGWATGKSVTHVVLMGVGLLLVGQVFDQLITPRVIGKQVGLHPVLGLFALMVGGQLFGLMGMVVAVPVAASVRVVLIHLYPRLGEPLPRPSVARETVPEAAVSD